MSDTLNPLSLQTERGRRAQRSLTIIQLYEKGELVNEIADYFECSKNTILRHARFAGLPKRPKCFPTEIRNAVIRDLQRKRTYKAISVAHGVSQAYISKVATEEGLQRYVSLGKIPRSRKS